MSWIAKKTVRPMTLTIVVLSIFVILCMIQRNC